MADIDPLAKLRTRFIERLAVDGNRLAKLSHSGGSAAEIIDIVHKLAGIAGSLGYSNLSRLALDLDQLHAASGTAEIAADKRLSELIEQIGAVVREG